MYKFAREEKNRKSPELKTILAMHISGLSMGKIAK